MRPSYYGTCEGSITIMGIDMDVTADWRLCDGVEVERVTTQAARLDVPLDLISREDWDNLQQAAHDTWFEGDW